MSFIILLLTALLLLATVVPLSRKPHWWIRVCDFPRLQLLLLALTTLSLSFLTLDAVSSYLTMAVSSCCLVYQFYWIFPYTPFSSREVKSAKLRNQRDSISILIANVLTPNRNSEKLLEIVRNNKPDILLTLESDKWWEEKLDCLLDQYPYSVKCPLDNLYGMHVYSKLLLHKSTIEYLVEEDIPSIHTEIEMKNGQKVRAHFLHPYPPTPEFSSSSSERDAELVVLARSLQECENPVIVAGDLNDVSWSETIRLFRRISGLLDPRVGRGMFNTFNARHWYLRWPLDHLFHSSHFQLSSIRRMKKFGSDHFAFFVELAYNNEHNYPDTNLAADKEDENFAEEILMKHDVEKKDVPMNEGHS